MSLFVRVVVEKSLDNPLDQTTYKLYFADDECITSESWEYLNNLILFSF